MSTNTAVFWDVVR